MEQSSRVLTSIRRSRTPEGSVLIACSCPGMESVGMMA